MFQTLDAYVISNEELGIVFSALLPPGERTTLFLEVVSKVLHHRFAESFRGFEFELHCQPFDLPETWTGRPRLERTHILHTEQEGRWVYEVRQLAAYYPSVALLVVMPDIDLTAIIRRYLLCAEVNSYLCYRTGDFPEGFQTF